MGTIACATKEFFTPQYHYTIVDAPGHRDFIKNMITGASQADVCLLMVPSDGNFTTAIAKGNAKAGEVPGQTRQHAVLINLLGVKQLIVGVNKMDCDMAGYKEARYKEVRDEMVHMLLKVGWKKDFVNQSVPVLPISGVFKIKGVGDVLTGRVEQGQVKPGDEVVFLPTHTPSTACTGKVFTVEMHHKTVDAAKPGDNVGLNIKGLNKDNMPRVGDVMVLKTDSSVNRVKNFTAQVQILNHPGELKCGYTPIASVRTARSAVKMVKINWKIGKETGGQKLEDALMLKANEMAEIVMEPQQPFVVDSFKACEGLGRVAIMEGNSVVMLGKVTKVERV